MVNDSTTPFPQVVRFVERPPTWRGVPYALAYVFAARELSAEELLEGHQWASRASLPHPRVITPSMLRWSSLFNPRFFYAVMSDPAFTDAREGHSLAWTFRVLDTIDVTRFWLQSVLFLAGVTLSAAVVQSRYSEGTIGSKFDRLWEAGTLADLGAVPELRSLALKDAVRTLVASSSDADVDRLLAIRRLYMSALARLAAADGDLINIKARNPSAAMAERFAFVDELRAESGPALRGVIVYGSSISSEEFADYDLLLIADDAEAVLRRFANRSPAWRGKELNLGVYTPDELIVMQQLSGDNLAEYGLCLWGEATVVRKPVEFLLARNFSFGVIRQRQQLGMLSRAIVDPIPADGDDRRNLHDYFVKIPANVAKGTFGALGSRRSKEEIQQWLRTNAGFDVNSEQASARAGDPVRPLARAVVASGAVLEQLNARVGLVMPAVDRHAMRKT